jgi:hypothetical protein
MYTEVMRTTINLDDDILSAARQLAGKRDCTLGQALSDIARRGLQPQATLQIRNGVPLLAPRPGGRKTTMALVNRLRDEK